MTHSTADLDMMDRFGLPPRDLPAKATKGDGDLRMLGARDGYAGALVHLRCQTMASLKQARQRINPRHVRKIADNERRLKPLLDLDAWLVDRIGELNIAYQKTREIEAAKLKR